MIFLENSTKMLEQCLMLLAQYNAGKKCQHNVQQAIVAVAADNLKDGGEKGWEKYLILTARYSSVPFVTFACKAAGGVVWDANSFVTTRI